MRHQIIILLALAMSACGGGTPDQDSGSRVEASSSYDEAYTAALAAMEIAAHKGHAWTTSDQLIKDAAKAVADGDEALAISLADEARIHAELAAVQAEDSAKSWRDSVVSE